MRPGSCEDGNVKPMNSEVSPWMEKRAIATQQRLNVLIG